MGVLHKTIKRDKDDGLWLNGWISCQSLKIEAKLTSWQRPFTYIDTMINALLLWAEAVWFQKENLETWDVRYVRYVQACMCGIWMTQLLPLYVALYSRALYLQSLSVYRVSEELGLSQSNISKHCHSGVDNTTLQMWPGTHNIIHTSAALKQTERLVNKQADVQSAFLLSIFISVLVSTLFYFCYLFSSVFIK